MDIKISKHKYVDLLVNALKRVILIRGFPHTKMLLNEIEGKKRFAIYKSIPKRCGAILCDFIMKMVIN